MTVREYLDKYKQKDILDVEITNYNRELIEEYPFLLPRNVWTDELAEDYDYSYTLMDHVPAGWRIAFGDELLTDLKKELVKSNYLDKYRIYQIKEKYGSLRWYDNGCTENWSKEILPKYERLSEQICIQCGRPAKYITKGWILPFCENCIGEQKECSYTVKEYFNER